MGLPTSAETWRSRAAATSPLAPAGDDCPICHRSHRFDHRRSRARILIAEDDPPIAELISYNLEQDGHDAAIAADGVTALSSLRQSPPDLLVLDLLLPLQSGWQVLRELRRSKPPLGAVPVLVVSALACDRLERELAVSGANRLLGKPFSMKELRDSVRDLLAAHVTGTTSADHSHATLFD